MSTEQKTEKKRAMSKAFSGVRSIEDVRLRCFIHPETGCWIWKGCFTGSASNKKKTTARLWLPEGLDGSGPMLTTARKGAWILSGRDLQPGQAVYRVKCLNGKCIRPEHSAAGTRQEMHQALADSNRLKGDLRRAAINVINRQSQLLPVDVVRKAEAMFDDGALQKEVVAALGICPESAKRIRAGAHPNSKTRARLLPTASVFSFGAAA